MYICNAYQLLPSNSTEYAYRYRELGRALVLSYDGPSALNVYNEIATELVKSLDAKLQHVFKNSYCMQNESSLSYEIALQLSKWHNNTNGNVSRKPRLPSPSAYTSSRLSVLMRMGGKHTLQRPKAFYDGLSKVGLAAAKTAAMRINLNIDGCGVVAPPVHSSLRAPHLLANLLAHNLPLPRAAH